MVKKISIIIFSAAILVTGFFAFRKLNYWERSVRIFRISNTEQPFEGRGEFSGRDGFDRHGTRELPNSIRSKFDKAGNPRIDPGNIPDSLKQQFRRNDVERIGRGEFGGGMGRRDGRGGGGEFPGGKKVNLRNVSFFLAVFAAFTVIAVYLDKAFCLIRKRFNSTPKQKDGAVSKA